MVMLLLYKIQKKHYLLIGEALPFNRRKKHYHFIEERSITIKYRRSIHYLVKYIIVILFLYEIQKKHYHLIYGLFKKPFSKTHTVPSITLTYVNTNSLNDNFILHALPVNDIMYIMEKITG